jgi:hypothetical protein
LLIDKVFFPFLFSLRENIENQSESEWMIIANSKQKIEITFLFLEISDDGGCYHDYVEIIDGDLSLGRFCGETPALVPILSTSNKLTIKFVSDEKIEARGFALTYKFLWGVPNVIRCDFNEQDLCRGWLQDHFDELDWKIRSGPTSSPNTGPQRGVENSSYAYMEASSPATYGDSAQLISAFMFMAPDELYCLSFQYHMFGKEIGALQVYTTERGFNVGKRLIWSRSGNQGDQWKIAQVPITGPVQFHSRERLITCIEL